MFTRLSSPCGDDFTHGDHVEFVGMAKFCFALNKYVSL
ncbi:hypothetical protein CAMSH0001_0681 [Campylobacter showae RM3277]|uniref:Uncharacterized protein n=1 Tax=Campylobacter showae RM3277 TaxID=553219 RepID=C6RGM4_9BACT|nr:hypothetical protein CAMSH0001_0681 [Campylobacter showae RM3277]